MAGGGTEWTKKKAERPSWVSVGRTQTGKTSGRIALAREGAGTATVGQNPASVGQNRGKTKDGR